MTDSSGFMGAYDTRSGYRLSDNANSATFGQADLLSDRWADALYPTVLYSKSASSVRDYLALYKHFIDYSSGAGSGRLAPLNSGNGGWQHTTIGNSSNRTKVNYFAFGIPTPESAMPRSGVYQYIFTGQGNYAADTDLYFTTQSGTLMVDFGAGSINGSLSVSGTNFLKDSYGGLYYVEVKGTIRGNSVAGDLSSAVAGQTGQYRLYFIGPNADELIITHSGSRANQYAFVGASIGLRNIYYK